MDDPENLPDLTDHLGFWMRMVSNAISHGFARKVEAEGVTVAEWVFLRALYGSERISPASLASRMGMTRGAISKLADRVEAKGLISRSGPEGRGQVLCLTNAGRAKLPILADLADGNDREFFDVLTEDDRRNIDRILKNLAFRHGLIHPPVN